MRRFKNFLEVFSIVNFLLGPFVDSSDIHLILEYDKDEKFEESSASRANRFIVHSDR